MLSGTGTETEVRAGSEEFPEVPNQPPLLPLAPNNVRRESAGAGETGGAKADEMSKGGCGQRGWFEWRRA